MQTFGRYDPHYLILPIKIRHLEPMYMDIWRAMMQNNLDQLKQLSRDVLLDQVTDANRNTLVHVSTMYGFTKMLTYLLTERPDGPDVNATNIFGTTAMHLTLEGFQNERYTTFNRDVLWVLLDAGADPRVMNSLGNSGLVAVAGTTHRETIFRIYRRMCELEHDKNELMKMLVHAGWSLSNFLWTEDAELIRKMLAYDSQALSVSNAWETTPLHEAVEALSSPEVFKLLLQYGANPNQAAGDQMNSPLHVALERSVKWDNLEIVKILLEAGANPHALNAKQCHCLHTALAYGSTEIVKLLLDKGVDLDAKDDTNNTAIHFAAFNGNLVIIKMLVDMGFGIDVKNSCGITPLHMASRKGRAEATEYLLKMGADVNWKDRRGWAALHYAVQSCDCQGPMHECLETIDVLVENGAELDTERPDEKSALALCVDTNYIPSGSYLVRCVAMMEPRNPEARARTIGLIYRNRILTEYYERCTKEIKKMKRKTLYGRISFYKALICSKKELKGYIRNPEFVSAMKKLIFCDYISDTFSIYRYRLIKKFITAMNAQVPINEAIEALCYLTDSADPTDEVLTTIVKFLGTEELKTLGKCKDVLERQHDQHNETDSS